MNFTLALFLTFIFSLSDAFGETPTCSLNSFKIKKLKEEGNTRLEAKINLECSRPATLQLIWLRDGKEYFSQKLKIEYPVASWKARSRVQFTPHNWEVILKDEKDNILVKETINGLLGSSVPEVKENRPLPVTHKKSPKVVDVLRSLENKPLDAEVLNNK